MKSLKEQAALPCHDLYSNMVTIIKVVCKMSWGENDICMEILVCTFVRTYICSYVHTYNLM